MNSYDDDLELVCEECEDNNGYIFGIYHYDGEDIHWEIDAQRYKSEEERDKAYG